MPLHCSITLLSRRAKMANDSPIVRVIITVITNTIPIILLVLAGNTETPVIRYSYVLAAMACALIAPMFSSKWGIGDRYTTLLQFFIWEGGCIITISFICEHGYLALNMISTLIPLRPGSSQYSIKLYQRPRAQHRHNTHTYTDSRHRCDRTLLPWHRGS